MNKLLFAFSQALENIRSNFLHTFLSILGIVIGVAALVGILSLIDGMEKYANEQLSSTTNLRNIIIRSQTYKTVGEVRIKKDTFALLDYWALKDMQTHFRGRMEAYLFTEQAGELLLEGKTESLGAIVSGVAPGIHEAEELLAGRLLSADDAEKRMPVAIINYDLAKQIAEEKEHAALVGKTIYYRSLKFTIVGVLKPGKFAEPILFIPFTLLPNDVLKESPPTIMLNAASVEAVPALETELKNWLQARYPSGKQDFTIVTNEFRVDQVAKGFLVFRLVMGCIVGIAVLVGGIGVMNVLLISVTERTPEIGLRKALGANRRDIMRLFLSESITISLLGSLLGLVFGILGTMLIVPIIRVLSEGPFQAAYTLNTLLVIVVIAIIIGIVFGTYPAIKAARLDPVEAIRRE
ncbi:MAG TPA: ABC transporter permease [Saprospiraceae bacterium]|nr:ABC transporter permease [Saprospiraceae bacterium]HMP24838.1 ABC transporter permease [Saprospiraceae bacterium]